MYPSPNTRFLHHHHLEPPRPVQCRRLVGGRVGGRASRQASGRQAGGQARQAGRRGRQAGAAGRQAHSSPSRSRLAQSSAVALSTKYPSLIPDILCRSAPAGYRQVRLLGTTPHDASTLQAGGWANGNRACRRALLATRRAQQACSYCCSTRQPAALGKGDMGGRQAGTQARTACNTTHTRHAATAAARAHQLSKRCPAMHQLHHAAPLLPSRYSASSSSPHPVKLTW